MERFVTHQLRNRLDELENIIDNEFRRCLVAEYGHKDANEMVTGVLVDLKKVMDDIAKIEDLKVPKDKWLN